MCQYFFKMADIYLVCYHGNGGCRKSSNIFFFTKTLCTVWAEKLALSKYKILSTSGVSPLYFQSLYTKDELNVDYRLMINHTISDIGVSSGL